MHAQLDALAEAAATQAGSDLAAISLRSRPTCLRPSLLPPPDLAPISLRSPPRWASTRSAASPASSRGCALQARRQCSPSSTRTLSLSLSTRSPPDLSRAISRDLGRYEYEGRAAIIHATALSFPGAAFHAPADAHPPRLDIALPASLGTRLAGAGAAAGADAAAATVTAAANRSYFYSCMRCNVGEAAGCLDPGRAYGVPQLERARKSGVPCLYYDPVPMAAICAMHPDAERNFEFHWWCHQVERYVVKPEFQVG